MNQIARIALLLSLPAAVASLAAPVSGAEPKPRLRTTSSATIPKSGAPASPLTER